METLRPQFLKRWFGVLTLFVVAGVAIPNIGLGLCAIVAIYALRGPKETVQALTAIAFLIILGKVDINIGRWLVLFAAFGRTIWDSLFLGRGTPRVTRPLLLFTLTVFLFAVLVSIFPIISILKLTTFAIGVGAALINFYRTRHLRQYWLSWIYTLGVFILVASLPFYVLPLGYAKNGAGFQGILTHPQTFGPVLAPITAMLTGLYLFQPAHKSKWTGFLVLLGWLGMYASLSRTSMLAAMLGLFLTVGIGFLFKSNTWGRVFRHVMGRREVILAGLVFLGLTASQWTDIQQQVSGFLFKDDQAQSVTGILEESRGVRMDRSMRNFWEAPLTGIGFGVPSDPQRFARQLERGPYGIPVSASVEKGFMPTAVLEETGIIGAVLVLVLLGYLFWPVVQRGSPTIFWMLASALLINFGEMVFFSIGGMGFYFWVVMAFCYNWSLGPPVPRRPPARVRQPLAHHPA